MNWEILSAREKQEQQGLTFCDKDAHNMSSLCSVGRKIDNSIYLGKGCIPAVLKMSRCYWGQLRTGDRKKERKGQRISSEHFQMLHV